MAAETGMELVLPDIDTPAEFVAAYVGLGPGLGAIGSLLAVGGIVVAMLGGLVWYPVKQALRAVRARRAVEDPDDAPSTPTDGDGSGGAARNDQP